ncbi:MAG: hypothetical protein ABF420_11265 [Acetobacter syzygii]|uniref:hypothetical protein n=1 Tax=Acetobacter syzygii TaxID=146476 RepID=UPI0039E7B1F5
MASPLEIALKNAIAERKKITDRLKDLNDFLEQTSRLSGIPLKDLLYSREEDEFTVDVSDEDDLVDSGERISQDDLERLILELIFSSPFGLSSVDEIMDELKKRGYDPGGQNKRKNLTTRIWRISEKKKTIIRVRDGEYGAAKNLVHVLGPDNRFYFSINEKI